MLLPIQKIRECFPALASVPDVLFDNAGGSQIPRVVADAIHDYMLNTYVQLGADYETAQRATKIVADAHDFLNLLMNGQGAGQVIMGSATTVLCHNLATCYAQAPRMGRDEIIVAETSHEANASPWYRLADHGFKVHNWPIMKDSVELDLNSLRQLLNERTRIVAFPHVCNAIGHIENAKKITALAHESGARVVIDGVAYAPHRAIDVQHIGADWYVYSMYKVFGPHMAAMFGRHDAIDEVEGLNYHFIPKESVPYKFELGGVLHEGCAGILALWKYLAHVVGDDTATPNRDVIGRAFARFTDLENSLQERLLEYLRGRSDVTIVGPQHSNENRISTISFVHNKHRSGDIAKAANSKRFGIRYGHFCAYKLFQRFAKDNRLHALDDGVVRVSALHYNTIEEIDGLIDCFESIL